MLGYIGNPITGTAALIIYQVALIVVLGIAFAIWQVTKSRLTASKGYEKAENRFFDWYYNRSYGFRRFLHGLGIAAVCALGLTLIIYFG
ncbi:hypothetical protein [Metabacillus sp. FJAT-52054]|uniref:DUF3899 domain-containing protein n=1 Tax=Metabacillus sediminis TaxID=3117746 RepID=A0ABZ2NMQ2_9BACI